MFGAIIDQTTPKEPPYYLYDHGPNQFKWTHEFAAGSRIAAMSGAI